MSPSNSKAQKKSQASLDEDIRRSVDTWRRSRDPIPSRSEAVRELLTIALKCEAA
jgi:hypothetical protein